jgi:hypothetical protein
MNGETERTEEGYGTVAKEEPKEDAGADALAFSQVQAPWGLYFWPWPGPGNSDGGGLD